MKYLIISDINLELFKKKYLHNNGDTFDLIYTENLIIELRSNTTYAEYDYVYIHFDNYFKKYHTSYLQGLLLQILYITDNGSVSIICSNLLPDGWNSLPLNMSSGIHSNYIFDYSEVLSKLKSKMNFSFLDLNDVLFRIGLKNSYNLRLGHLYQMPYTKLFMLDFAQKLESTLNFYATPEKKVIVLDCDNTLWRGIIGEDGVAGVYCDLNAKGIVFYHFQQFIFQKKQQGFILCLCSKNNESDVFQAFNEKRMPLKWDDFALKRINWEHKDQNILEISSTLNLSLDSFIFIDDSEFELNLIKDNLPEIKIFKMSDSYDDLTKMISDITFSRKFITVEDTSKTEQYVQESLRKDLQKVSQSFDDYLISLCIVTSINIDNEDDIPRASQLTEKTNQFNFNKKVFSPEFLRHEIMLKKMKMFTLRVSDKFGDYGLTGVILIDMSKENLILENFILSCRILGRNIEHTFLDEVNQILLRETGKKIQSYKFTENQKNIPAKEFYYKLLKNEYK